MIPPYEGSTILQLGPISLPLFGMLVVTGVFVGHWWVIRSARERGLDLDDMRNAAAWAVGAGFIGAHVVDVVAYHPDRLARDGIVALVEIWQGISSYGGFFGAFAGVAFYYWRLGRSWWTEADLLIQGLVFGWVFGRLGCTLTSDHLGSLSSFPLAFAYPTGARHNVGFYELVYTVVVLVPAVFMLRRRERDGGYWPGMYVATLAALYAPARFVLDFLRAADIAHPDPRWIGMTAAQYFSIAVLLAALWLLKSRQAGMARSVAS